MQTGPLLSRLMLLAAAMLFSTGGMAIKSCELTDWQIAGFRCGIAAFTLLLLVPASRHGWSPRILAVAVAYAVTLVCYSLANKATTSANAIFLQSSAPLYILVLAPILLGERNRKRDLLFMMVMAAGLALFFISDQPASTTAPEPAAGNLYGALAGLTWAMTILGLRWLAGSPESAPADAVRAVVVGNLLAFFGTLPLALPVMSASTADWGWVAYLGVFQIAIAYLLLTRGIERVPAFEASLLLLAEPIFNPIWTWWKHGEIPTHGALLGGVLMLSAATLKARLDFDSALKPDVGTT